MINAIIFDWGDTLSPGIPEGGFPVERIKRKFKLNEKKINQCLEILEQIEGWLKNVPDPRSVKQERKIQNNFWGMLAQKTKIKDGDSFVNYLLEWNLEKATPILFPEVLDTISYLSKKNYTLGILSNGWPSRLLEIQRTGIAEYFKVILVSSIIGAEKPDIKAYQIALKKIGIPANQILMVDNKEEYLNPAHKLGMKVVYLDRIDFDPNSKFPRIKDISEIEDYIKQYRK